ncbi:MAG: DUF4190 domain-containing protein [Ruminococcaceae bacterium]|nr:DUF4190 domain-containing protein [Oscillospiraceae bacterium]
MEKKNAAEVDNEKEMYSSSGELLPYSDKYVPDEELDPTADEPNSSDERYNEIFNKSKHKTRLWSLISFVFALASVALCFFGWIGLAFAVCAVVMSFVSRRLLGYFDGFAVAGLICGIFGVVFSAVKIIIEMVM